MRTVSIEQRRRAVVARHHLGGDAVTPEEAVADLVALHATDPASVYLSVLARSAGSTTADVADAMYQRRTLVRWMAMRRTVFLFPTADIPMVQAAISTPLAATLHRQLLNRLHRNGTDPAVEGDLDAWLTDLAPRVEKALRIRGAATGAELSAAEPALRTLIPPRAPSDRPQNLTTALLTLLGAQGRIIRATPTGAWTSRHHRWEPVETWWPAGLPHHDPHDARRDLARRWLTRFGPATVEDLQWWTGWNRTTTRDTLAGLAVEEVDLHGRPGIALPTSVDALDADRFDADLSDTEPQVATLLPALDPTPMGWKHRDWLFGIPQHHVFDTHGNIGPTLWWNGEIIGSWAVTATGEIRTAILADRGHAARTAVDTAAAALHARLGATVVTPAIRTPLERTLTDGDPHVGVASISE